MIVSTKHNKGLICGMGSLILGLGPYDGCPYRSTGPKNESLEWKMALFWNKNGSVEFLSGSWGSSNILANWFKWL